LIRYAFPIGFRTKVYAGIVSVVLLSGILIAISVSQIVIQAFSDEYRSRGEAMAASLSRRGVDAILAVDVIRMKGLIDETVKSGEDILYAFILNQRGEVLSHSFDKGFPVALRSVNPVSAEEQCRVRLLTTGKETIYDFATPVLVGDQQVGTVRLGLLRSRITNTINNLLWAMVAFILISVVIADLVGVILARNVTGRVLILRKAAEDILKGDLSVRALSRLYPQSELKRKSRHFTIKGDEIRELAESFDAMTRTLKAHIDALALSKSTLEKSEAKYRHIFEGSMDLIFVADREMRILDINPAGAALLEYMNLPKTFDALMLSQMIRDPHQFETLSDFLHQKGYIRDWECRLVTRTGREIDVLMSMTTRQDPGEGIVEYEGIVKDITRRKMMRKQLLQADRLASIGQLSAGVAHEINNPLGLILGYTQLLIRQAKDGSEFIKDLRTIEKQTRNCKKIVEALLNFARKTETQRSEISVNDSVAGVIDVIGGQIEKEGIHIRTEFDTRLPRILADGEKLKQVWMNLLMNARQAIGADGEILITTGIEAAGERIYVSVEDTGSGISTRFLDKIFDPFFTTKPTGQGTGLGLSVSYGIIQDHQGEITVRSEEGMGAVFTIFLPLSRPNMMQPEPREEIVKII
jgi:two-component system, NtrC family, sensor kinase